MADMAQENQSQNQNAVEAAPPQQAPPAEQSGGEAAAGNTAPDALGGMEQEPQPE